MSPDLHHLSGAYAVDALDDAERTSFEQHLAVCADCRAEVAELSATAHSLSSLTETTPPPSLRASVLTGIAQVRPLPPPGEDAEPPAPAVSATTADTPEEALADTGGTAGAGDGTGGDAASGPDQTPGEGADEPEADTDVVPIRRRPRTAWFAAAAAAAVLAIGALAWSPWSDDTGSRSPMAQVAAAADAMTVRTTSGGATAEVAYSKQLGKAAISVKGMPPPPDGKTYQVWYVGPGGTATSAGLLGVDAEGSGQALLAGRVAPTDTVAMTVEPAGGSPQPTSEPLVVLPLA